MKFLTNILFLFLLSLTLSCDSKDDIVDNSDNCIQLVIDDHHEVSYHPDLLLNASTMYDLDKTDDGFILAGVDGDQPDIKVLKLTQDLSVEWSKTIKGNDFDAAYDIQELIDQDFILCGSSRSISVGANDAVVSKISKNGSISWIQNYGGIHADKAESIIPTNDGGYIFTGTTSDEAFDTDVSIRKIDFLGNQEWAIQIDSLTNDSGITVFQLQNNDYLVGSYFSDTFSRTIFSILIINPIGKVKKRRNIELQESGIFNTFSSKIIKTNSDNFILLTHESSGGSPSKIRTITFDEQLNVLKEKVYCNNNGISGQSILELENGDILITGTIQTDEALVSSNIIMFRTDAQGNVQWSKTYSMETTDVPYDAVEHEENIYISTTITKDNSSKQNFLLLKIDAQGEPIE